MAAAGEPSFPKQAGEVGKGDLILMNEKRPCKIVEYSISKTGKHGHARASITAIDIFDGRKYEDAHPTTHNIECPYVQTTNPQMTNYDDTHVYYMEDDGTAGEIALPTWPENYDDQLKAAFDDSVKNGVNLVITVQRSMGFEQVMAHRSEKN